MIQQPAQTLALGTSDISPQKIQAPHHESAYSFPSSAVGKGVSRFSSMPPQFYMAWCHGSQACAESDLNALWNPKLHCHNHKTTNLDISSN